MISAIRRAAAFIAAAWRAGAAHGPLTYEEVKLDLDDLIRESLGELEVPEALALARAAAQRDGEKELAAALQAVLLLHLTGGSLAAVAALVLPDQTSQVVN